MRRKLLTTAVILLAFTGMMSAGTLAMFTDTDAVAANTFTAGKISLSTNPTTAAVSFANMMPGDTVTNPVVVTNDAGSAALRYAVSSVATNTDTKGLKDQLVLTVKTGVTTCTTAGFTATGIVAYTGDLDSAAGKIIGDSAQGAQAGDRTLAIGASETLCFQVNLPLATGNTYQSATTTATFTFDSEQTANNP